MKIISDQLYSITDTSVILDMHPRTLQRRAKSMGARMIDGRYLFSGSQIEKLILDDTTTTRQATAIATTEELSDTNTINVNVDALNILKKRLKELENENAELRNELTKEIPHQEKLRNAIQLITIEAMQDGVMHKIFTDEEYNDIIGTISEVDFQKEQVQYLRGRVEKQDEVLKKLVQQTSERNYIEAKEKGFDKK